jgi:anti-sigma factor ChrR (cupin superfamily)
MTTLAEGLVLVRAAVAEWQPHPVWAGTSMKLLYHNPENGGEYTALVKLSEGAVLPHRRHVKPEEMWMISGSATCGDHDIRVGEYTRAEAGSHHPKLVSRQGCIFLLKGFDDDEILDSNPPAAELDP